MHLNLQPSYSITREYTFTRIQGIAIAIVALILAALFAIVSVATTGYEIHIEYNPDPVSTEANQEWFQKAPFSWFGTMKTSCQDALVSVGATGITKNRGFAYTIDRISAPSFDPTAINVTSQIAYRDQTLENCDISKITINLQRLSGGDMTANDWTWGATTASATSTCQITTEDKTYDVSFRIDLAPALNSDTLTTSFLTGNQSKSLVLWDGVNIMSQWYDQIPRAMSYQTPPSACFDESSWANGQIILTRNTSAHTWQDDNFFAIDYSQPTQQGHFANLHRPNPYVFWLNEGPSEAGLCLPRLGMTVSAFAKSLSSLILTDVGQFGSANAFATMQGLQYFQHYTDTVSYNLSQQCWGSSSENICAAGRIKYNISDLYLQLSATQLESQYLCSVPKPKARISILYSVVLAEIVFLRTCWSIFSIVASWRLKDKDPSTNYCDSCVKQRKLYRNVHEDSYSMSSNITRRSLLRAEDADMEEAHAAH